MEENWIKNDFENMKKQEWGVKLKTKKNGIVSNKLSWKFWFAMRS